MKWIAMRSQLMMVSSLGLMNVKQTGNYSFSAQKVEKAKRRKSLLPVFAWWKVKMTVQVITLRHGWLQGLRKIALRHGNQNHFLHATIQVHFIVYLQPMLQSLRYYIVDPGTNSTWRWCTWEVQWGMTIFRNTIYMFNSDPHSMPYASFSRE